MKMIIAAIAVLASAPSFANASELFLDCAVGNGISSESVQFTMQEMKEKMMVEKRIAIGKGKFVELGAVYVDFEGKQTGKLLISVVNKVGAPLANSSHYIDLHFRDVQFGVKGLVGVYCVPQN